MTKSIWDVNKTKQLQELVERGLSAPVIGNILGTTKNSIIGKCHRLGFKLGKGRAYHRNKDAQRKNNSKSHKSAKLKQRLYLKPVIKEPLVKIKTRKFLKVKMRISNNDEALGMNVLYERLGIPPIPDRNCCHYINGDDIKNGNHTWCCEVTYKNTAYCERHYGVIYALKSKSPKSKSQNYKIANIEY